MGKKVRFSFIIVTWNSKKYITRCIKSIYDQTCSDYEIIVVDNGSRDGTTEEIATTYPDVLLVKNSVNEGFCAANNRGIEKSSGEYIVVLNSDAFLGREFLQNMDTAIKSCNIEVGMFNPKVLSASGDRIDTTGLVLSGFRRFFDRGSGFPANSRCFMESSEIFGPCACCAVYNRKLLDSIKTVHGYFDERFFFLLEDFDIAWRARKKGWVALFVPDALCFHERHSSAHNERFLQYLSFRNRYFLIVKNERVAGLLRYIPIIILYDIPRVVYLLFTNAYVFKALRDLGSVLPEMLRERLSERS